jgi:hypothetical protein
MEDCRAIESMGLLSSYWAICMVSCRSDHRLWCDVGVFSVSGKRQWETPQTEP